MDILLNGQPQLVPDDLTLSDLLQQCHAVGPHIAVALNETVIPRTQCAAIALKSGDRVEIVRAVGGG